MHAAWRAAGVDAGRAFVTTAPPSHTRTYARPHTQRAPASPPQEPVGGTQKGAGRCRVRRQSLKMASVGSKCLRRRRQRRRQQRAWELGGLRFPAAAQQAWAWHGGKAVAGRGSPTPAPSDGFCSPRPVAGACLHAMPCTSALRHGLQATAPRGPLPRRDVRGDARQSPHKRPITPPHTHTRKPGSPVEGSQCRANAWVRGQQPAGPTARPHRQGLLCWPLPPAAAANLPFVPMP